MPRKYEVWRCPDCGEQITDPPEYNQRTGEYSRGHYHDPPEGWWTEDGGRGPQNLHGEDPWFDAVPVTAIDERDVSPLVSACQPLAALARGHNTEGNPHAMVPVTQLHALLAALKPFEAEEGSG